jgi:Lysylphosphatidylglycerol synthase TM region
VPHANGCHTPSVGGPLDDVLDRLAAADLRLVAAALLVQCLALALRGHAWRNALAGASPPVAVRTWEATAALVAGMAINGLVPGKLGEGIKVGLMRCRARESSLAGIAGALVSLSPCDVALVGVAATGAVALGVAPGAQVPSLALAAAVAVAFVAVGAVLLRRRLARLEPLRALAGGAALVARPGAYAAGVALPLVAAFGLRLAVASLLLAAFGLAPTLGAALVVFAAGGLARMVPLGSGSLAAEGALLLAAFGGTESGADVIAFTAGAGGALLALHLCAGLVATALLLGTVRPGAVLARARTTLA